MTATLEEVEQETEKARLTGTIDVRDLVVPAAHLANIPYLARFRTRRDYTTSEGADRDPKCWPPARVEAAARLYAAGDRTAYATVGHRELTRRKRYAAAVEAKEAARAAAKALEASSRPRRRPGEPLVPIGPAHAHLTLLIEAGVKPKEIRAAARIGASTMQRLRAGKGVVTARVDQAILAVPIPNR